MTSQQDVENATYVQVNKLCTETFHPAKTFIKQITSLLSRLQSESVCMCLCTDNNFLNWNDFDL